LNEKEYIAFEKLKKAVAQTFLKENSALSEDYSLWKGADIIRFQEDLLHKVKGRVSEKWFYTYFKNKNEKLPRIDILNLLSQYAGYQNWANFKNQNQTEDSKIFARKWLWSSLIVTSLLFLIVPKNILKSDLKQVRLCFYGSDHHKIKHLQVVWLLPDESEKILKTQQECVRFQTDLNEIQLRITAPYYVGKLIKRKINTDHYTEEIDLRPDLIALLLQHYSQSDTDNWQNRRRWLQHIIADDAMIFQQLSDKNRGIELFTKKDFIAQLCIPTGWLKSIDILEITYKNGKVNRLRFKIKTSQ